MKRTRICIFLMLAVLIAPAGSAQRKDKDGPKCEDCKAIKRSLYECLHFAHDKDGAPCSTKECIENVLDSASCVLYPDRTGEPKCNTKIVNGPAIVQTGREAPDCPSAGTVQWSDWLTTVSGCGKDCNAFTWRKACETKSCDGKITRGPFNRGERAQCGC